MPALVTVVAGIEITAQDSREIVTDQLLDDGSRPRVVVFVIAHLRRAHTPNIAVDAIFAPPCFIGLHRRTAADLAFEVIKHGLGMLTRSEERRVGKEGRSRWSPYH